MVITNSTVAFPKGVKFFVKIQKFLLVYEKLKNMSIRDRIKSLYMKFDKYI